MYQNYVSHQSKADTTVPKYDTGVPISVPGEKINRMKEIHHIMP